MKTKLLLIPFAVLLFVFSASAQEALQDSIQVISIEKFEKMSTKKKARILDVRTPEEVSEGHLTGALNINYLGETFAEEIEKLDKKKTYLLYCRSGSRTRKAADLMQDAGFKHVYMLEGGITAWKEAGKPIEK
ncbi:rhodanese-like domain-containing protein [Algoriphagus taiwanensis]|uniref:Rhodanese domain-containing protein n=1 Tax=Algoriphagus taiwanensis TaxID=1445656 RepID=A0ABQ6Q0L5_9BACT|nr:hypothetical protein Ataiwa_16780 [Algoriphagus taiwanensis]